jgi:hypothetical protein
MNSPEDRSIILVIGDRSLGKRLAAPHATGSGASWLYLGRDFRMSMHLDQVLGSMERYHFGDRLQEIARTYRQDYIDFIGGLASSRRDLTWWLTSISEKNPFITTVFLHACYIHLCREYAERFPGDILVICESGSLMDAIALNLRDIPRTRIQIHHPWRIRAMDAAKAQFEKISSRIWFLLRFAGRILLSRIFAILRRRRPGNASPRILIHSWADTRAFSDPISYTDAYFGTLGKKLSERGYPCAYGVSVLPTIPYHRALSALLKYPEEIYLFEEFIGFRDLFSALAIRRGADEELFTGITMGELDLSPVLRAELRADRLTARAEQSFLAYRSALRIPRAFSVRTFIYTFENHMWEKMFCAGFRLASPGTSLVGYAHSVVSPMYLSYSLSRFEKETMPLPDLVAVNGPHARENLVASGFPAEGIVVTGSFRYPHFGRGRPPLEDRQERSVLVPLAAGIDESLELALKSVLALGGMQGIRVILKPHPSISRDTLLASLPDLPASVDISSDPVDRLLDGTDLVLYTSTTVAVEALGRGIPLVHVKSDLAIDRNILEGFPMVPSAADPEEIREMAVRVLENRETVGEEGKKAVLDLITPSGEGSIYLILRKPA